MVFNVTFNNISVISWWSVLLVEETWVPRENHQPAASHFLWSPTLWNISNGDQVSLLLIKGGITLIDLTDMYHSVI
jgi:hypothetical protein